MSRYRWDMRPTEINAYYSPQNNKIGENEFTLTGPIMVKCTTRAQFPPSFPPYLPLNFSNFRNPSISSQDLRREFNNFNRKNYNFFDCDWFKKLLLSTNCSRTVQKANQVKPINHIQSCSLN